MRSIAMTRTGDRRTIVFLIGALNGGGAERIFLTLLRHLDRNLFAPHLVLLQAEGELISEIPRDVVVHDLGGARRDAHGSDFRATSQRMIPATP